MKKDVMLDIETLGNNLNPVITQISGVVFDLETGETFEEFNVLVDPMSCIKHGLQINQSTMEFWADQDKDVFKKVVLNSFEEGETLQDSLKALNKFLDDVKAETIWGNGIMADNVWLESAFKAANIVPTWKFFQHRDVRTIVDLGQRLNTTNFKRENEFIGDRHNAIDDCKFQIKYCSDYVKSIKELK